MNLRTAGAMAGASLRHPGSLYLFLENGVAIYYIIELGNRIRMAPCGVFTSIKTKT
jgi:hypothetical protein